MDMILFSHTQFNVISNHKWMAMDSKKKGKVNFVVVHQNNKCFAQKQRYDHQEETRATLNFTKGGCNTCYITRAEVA